MGMYSYPARAKGVGGDRHHFVNVRNLTVGVFEIMFGYVLTWMTVCGILVAVKIENGDR